MNDPKIQLYTFSEHLGKDMEKIQNVTWFYDRESINYPEIFDINEFPTLLVFDTKGLVLQTTSVEEFFEFISSK